MKKGDIVRFKDKIKKIDAYSSCNREYVVKSVRVVESDAFCETNELIILKGFKYEVLGSWLELINPDKEKNCSTCSGFLKNKHGMSECRFCVFPLHDCIIKGFSEYYE